MFYEKVHIKTDSLKKKKNILVIVSFNFFVEQKCIARNREFQFVYLTKTVNVIFFMKKVDLNES